MKCRVTKIIYQNKDNGFCVLACQTRDESVPQAARNTFYKSEGIQFTAVGYNLPESGTVEIDMQGEWEKGKRGLQFSVESYQIVMPRTREGIIGYLSSGMIKGIGEKLAERIVDKFGTRTFEIMDHYPDSLLEVKGITRKKLDAIMVSYHGTYVMRDLAAYLTPFHVTPKKIQKIYEAYGEKSLEVVKEEPYSLCKINGFGFLTVDEIAKANRKAPNDPMRIEDCIGYCMEQGTQDGHVFVDKPEFQKAVCMQLNKGYPSEVVTEREVYNVLNRMVKEKSLSYEEGALYSAKLFEAECGAAKSLVSLLLEEDTPPAELDRLVSDAQKELDITLSAKQMEAVRKAFLNKVTIITGGPGTGKTTVQKVLLYLNGKLKGGTVLLTAPTGRASRRMAESTGCTEARTMHSALGLTNDEDSEGVDEMLDADFIIADEFTMSDMMLSFRFFSHVKKGTRLVLVGDVNQLPSVGPGNVFRELILSGIIPTTELDMVFRQKGTSRIPMNAHRMLENNASLDYGQDFAFYPAKDAEEAAETITRLYADYVRTHGLDKVQVLSPFRKKSAAGVNALNDALWNMVNPKTPATMEIQAGGQTYRTGDKVMHNRNKDNISNGDIGFIRDIFENEDGDRIARIDFGDERIVEYGGNELEMVEHSYATTIHKSQGSEYPVVIIPWLPMFFLMLKRNILYTAVTRAKEQVIIVGDKRSVCTAIRNDKSSKRNTRLGERLIKEYNSRVSVVEKGA